MQKEKMYSVAVRKRANANDYFWNHDDFTLTEFRIKSSYRYWIADPFVYEKDSNTYIFYEAYDLVDRKGKIGYSMFNSSKDIARVNIAIDKPYHLSFPNIFDHNGNIYIMPETCENHTVELFRAIDFPTKWIQEKVILEDLFVCDSAIAENKGSWYLIVSEMYAENVPNNNYASCWVKNVRYLLDGDLNVVGQGEKVAEGDYGIRNAGSFLNKNGALIRVGQNCLARQYGKGLVFYEVDSLSPYKETLLFDKDCKEFDKHIVRKDKSALIGAHTYNVSEHYEVIDFSQIKTVQMRTRCMRNRCMMREKFKHYRRGVKRLIKRILGR